MNTEKKNWYALYTKVNQEFKAKDYLDSIGVENYLPAITRIKQWSDRKKKITEPVLRGYIFIYSNEYERIQSLQSPSIVRCVSQNGKPAVIPEWQIENFRNLIERKIDYLVYEGLVPGQYVEILNGPLKGLKGIIIKSDESKRFAVSIELLNRSIIVEIPAVIEIKSCPGITEQN